MDTEDMLGGAEDVTCGSEDMPDGAEDVTCGSEDMLGGVGYGRHGRGLQTALALLLAGLMAVSIFGFAKHGTFEWSLVQPEYWRMLAELAFCGFILWLFCAKIRDPIVFAQAVICLVAAFAWLHRILVGLIVAGLYLGYIRGVGRIVFSLLSGRKGWRRAWAASGIKAGPSGMATKPSTPAAESAADATGPWTASGIKAGPSETATEPVGAQGPDLAGADAPGTQVRNKADAQGGKKAEAQGRKRDETQESEGYGLPWYLETTLGMAALIVVFCLMSLAGVGQIRHLQLLVVATGVLMWALNRRTEPRAFGPRAFESRAFGPRAFESKAFGHRAFGRFADGLHALRNSSPWWVVACGLVFFLHLGRMNLALDFDSLWYGLRSPYVLENGRGIYENLGNIGVVYTYPKGLEILLLPLSNLPSYGFILAFQFWTLVLTLGAVWVLGSRVLDRQWVPWLVALTLFVPGISGMCLSAKPDLMTLFVQLVMLVELLAAMSPRPGAGIMAWDKSFVATDIAATSPGLGAGIMVARPSAGRQGFSGAGTVPRPGSINDDRRAFSGSGFWGHARIGSAIHVVFAFGACVLTFAMKPTALVFSTAICGLWVCLWAWGFKAPVDNESQPDPAAAPQSAADADMEFGVYRRRGFAAVYIALHLALLALVWGRTFVITGLPVTSVFASLFTKLGFALKYPFDAATIPDFGGSLGFGAWVIGALKRMAGFFICPVGEDMDHVILAWGSPGILFFFVVWLVYRFAGRRRSRKAPADAVSVAGEQQVVPLPGRSDLKAPADGVSAAGVRQAASHPGRSDLKAPADGVSAAGVRAGLSGLTFIAVPFMALNLYALLKLDQVDGNYFMLCYVLVILLGVAAAARAGLFKCLLVAMCVYNFFLLSLTNWAWVSSFTPIKLLHGGYFDHRGWVRERMEATGNGGIYNILAENPRYRVISVGEHPDMLLFPCNTQSYADISGYWGNVKLVYNTVLFERFLRFAQTDYIYLQGGFLEESEWCLGLMRYLVEYGVLRDVVYENGNVLARVDAQVDLLALYELEEIMQGGTGTFDSVISLPSDISPTKEIFPDASGLADMAASLAAGKDALAVFDENYTPGGGS
ncbi:MAG: hypothetical protein LBR77_06100 [Lachnospiraceae bacterium]|nr:hypothetical protein [Lachnospiraceae bacterium]